MYRWFRFSLRGALLFVAALSIWLGYVHSTVRRERLAAGAIHSAHGKIVYDWQVRQTEGTPKDQPVPPGPKWLRTLLGRHYFERIVKVNFNHYHKSDAKIFAEVAPHLAKLKELRSLRLWGMDLSPTEFRMLGRLKSVEALHVRQDAAISDTDAAALANLESLRELNISETIISAIGVSHFAELPNLEKLSISCKYMFVGRQITITEEYMLGDDAAFAIAECPRLRSLVLTKTLITDAGVKALSRLAELDTLTVGSPNVTGNSLDYVRRMKNLRWLGTWSWDLQDDDIRKLQQLPKLKSLSLLVKTPLTDTSLPHLATLQQIRFLDVNGNDITDAGIQHLHTMTNLRRLDLSDTRVRKHGSAAKQLEQALSKCSIRFPKTEREKKAEAAFQRMKWGN